jgi:hypothetical protein
MAGALTAAIAAAFSGGAAVVTDDYFEYTTLLLPGNGTNGAQNNTFLDGSTNNFTITRNGNTTQGTFSPFSQTGWGNYFDGTGDSIYASSANTANAMGTGDWTIEASVYKTNSTEGYVFDTLALTGGSTDAIRIAISSSGAVYFYKYSTLLTSGGSIALNTWNHIAVVRQSQTIKIYLNGTQVNTTYSDTGSNYTCGTNRPLVGINGYDIASDPFQGYISNLRAVKGVAVYTGNFTPPTSPLAATQSAGTNISAITGTQTSLLTCQSNRFIDNSSNNFTITRNGDTRVVAFSPFNPSASWSAATNGGSGYFDGNGDYLTVPANAAFTLTGDFCVEFWVYSGLLAGGATNPTFINDSAGSNSSIFYETNGSNRGLCLYAAGAARITTATNVLVENQWNHVAILRSGTTGTNTAAFVNGTRVGTATAFTGTVDFSPPVINRYGPSAAGYLNGYMSNFRIVKGSSVYDPTSSTITVPTAPLTNITNTSLLLNFTNAGIYDATSKNDLETVGNAQISTTQSKWGGGSMYFDGNGDYLQTPSNPILPFGTGDFTIEFWAYWAGGSFTSYATAIDTRNGSVAAGLAIAANITTGAWYVSISAQEILGTVAAAASWQHIAVTRSGTSLRLFVNGTQTGSTYTSSNDFSNTTLRVGLRPDNQYPWNGYLQDLRITKGYARYTSNFTAPTAAFPTL